MNSLDKAMRNLRESKKAESDKLAKLVEKKALKESKEDLDKNSNKTYKQVIATFECDDCGHKEDWTLRNMTERELADLEASDSNDEVGDCPECGSIHYNMKKYKVAEENKKEELNEDIVETTTRQDLIAIQEKGSGLYDYVANNYYKMTPGELKELALNAIYVADADAEIIQEYLDRNEE